ncbi:oxidized low-density lipoprotein receptor 1-like isoform X2 [Kryptolebias marmoratus]|uniref:oxidized low-density lipoprotein receptor 1-like isoform X2 n=1 Tax=Kryptolebias marmoratus TaxID=37003 RepID=UPI0018ACBD1D|nr:oxidized low-density lipoprotein receptor 1-like isoform X2 [Kryptolebias marmoratus]
MEVDRSSSVIYENFQRRQNGTAPNVSSDVIYENFQRPRREEQQNPNIISPAADVTHEKRAAPPHFRLLLMCLLIVCVLLVVTIIIIIWMSVELKKQETNLREQMKKTRHWENQTEQLAVEKRNLENQTQALSRERDDLSWKLEVIMTLDNFPVKGFCPNKKPCQPCQTGWIQRQEKCYLFYDSSCKTKEDSLFFCESKGADLAVIDDNQEQVFITQSITNNPGCLSYNGYFNNGQYYVLGYRIKHGLVTLKGNVLDGSSYGSLIFNYNRFICEGEVMKWNN